MWLLNSSIGKKVVMSLTGLFLILFLTFHMSMNLVAIFSEEGYNMVCEFLGANWYALAGTAVIAAGAVLHILFALWLTYINRRARGKDRYKVTEKPKDVEWASQNMLVLGIIVVIGISHALVPILVQNAVQRNYRYPSRGKSPRRICPYCRNTGKSYHGHHLSGMVRCYLVPPHTWLLERHSDIGLEQ